MCDIVAAKHQAVTHTSHPPFHTGVLRRVRCSFRRAARGGACKIISRGIWSFISYVVVLHSFLWSTVVDKSCHLSANPVAYRLWGMNTCWAQTSECLEGLSRGKYEELASEYEACLWWYQREMFRMACDVPCPIGDSNDSVPVASLGFKKPHVFPSFYTSSNSMRRPCLDRLLVKQRCKNGAELSSQHTPSVQRRMAPKYSIWAHE